MRAAFVTLGCKVNQYETQAMTEQLLQRGWNIADACEEADLYIIHSCTVTAESDRKTRQAVRRCKRLHPQATVLLCGCMPQAFPEQAKALTQADIVIGNRNKQDFLSALDTFMHNGERYFHILPFETEAPFALGSISGFRERTRANIKIEDGCDCSCAYCAIPLARGKVRSKPLDTLRQESESLAQTNFRELVLVGINLSAYGRDLGCNLCDAVDAAAASPQILRVRLGSLEPDLLTDAILQRFAAQTKLCPQFHISLQSGCDATLRQMRRRYNTAQYRALCGKLRKLFPDCTLTTDIMAGFPGETEEDFAQSLAFVREIGFEKLHIFPYSRREGTAAAGMPGQIPKQIKEERCRALEEAAREMHAAFLHRQIGKTLSVLPEEQSGVFAQGYSANYTPIRIPRETVQGKEIDVCIQTVQGDWCIGQVLTETPSE